MTIATHSNKASTMYVNNQLVKLLDYNFSLRGATPSKGNTVFHPHLTRLQIKWQCRWANNSDLNMCQRVEIFLRKNNFRRRLWLGWYFVHKMFSRGRLLKDLAGILIISECWFTVDSGHTPTELDIWFACIQWFGFFIWSVLVVLFNLYYLGALFFLIT